MKKISNIISGILLIVTRILYIYFFSKVYWTLWCTPYSPNIKDLAWLIFSLFVLFNSKKIKPFLFIIAGIVYFIDLDGCFADRVDITNILMGITLISLGIYTLKDLFKKNKILTKIWFLPIIINLVYDAFFIYEFKYMAFKSFYKIERVLLFVIPILLFISILTICIPKKSTRN